MMLASGSKKEKIAFLSEFYERRYGERNFKFRASEVNLSLNPKVSERLILEITLCTDFRIMKFRDSDGDYFIICKK